MICRKNIVCVVSLGHQYKRKKKCADRMALLTLSLTFLHICQVFLNGPCYYRERKTACCYYIMLLYYVVYYIVYYIILYYIISYHIISYHIISYHIISHHIISYHISCHISYHIISELNKSIHNIQPYTKR